MSRNSLSPALLFVHIPKTAGSTLEQILLRQYRAADIYPFIELHDYARVRTLPPEQKARYKLFQGHMPYGLHKDLPQPARYVTLLRNPIQVALSSYFYFERGYRRDVLHQNVTTMVPTVADLEQSKMRSMFDNLQTRYLSGLMRTPFGECSREMVELAKAHLARDFVLGLVERFDEAVVSLANIFGWRAPYYIRTNVSRTRMPQEQIATDVLAWLREQNRFDIELYAFAETLFDTQIKTLGKPMAQAVQEYRIRNRRYGSLCDWLSRAKRKAARVKFIGEFV